MTPKEKAEDLMKKYSNTDIDILFMDEWLCATIKKAAVRLTEDSSKQCALIAVEEILELDNFSIEGRDYWQEVKQEIDNL